MVLYEINVITSQHKADPIAVTNYMAEKNWIREQWIHQNDVVRCKITVEGMEEIDPSFIREKLRHVIGMLCNTGGKKSLTEMLQHKIEEYAIVLDIIYRLERMKLITIIHDYGRIDLVLTDSGWRHAEQGKPLLALISVA